MPAMSRVDSGAYGVSLAIYGLAELERALKALTPDVRKELDRSIRDALRPTVSTARSRLPESPMSGWSADGARKGRTRGGAGWPGWDARRAGAGISIRRGSPWARRRTTLAVAWRIESREAAATIFDKATLAHSRTGEQFIVNLNRHGKAQRVLWPAWLANRGQALDAVEAAVGRAEAELQRHVNAIDGRRAAA